MTVIAATPTRVALHVGASAARLGAVRVLVCVMWLAIVVPDPLAYLAALPATMGQPVGVFHMTLGPDALNVLKGALIVLLVGCLAGVPGWRVLAPLTALLLTAQQALLRRYTFDNHEELALLIVTWVMALFPAADGLSWPRRRARGGDVYAVALQAMTAFLLVPYCLIAAHRLATAAPGVFTGESLPYWLASLHALDRDGWGTGLWALGHPGLVTALKAGFFATTIFELLGPVCLVAPRFAVVWAIVVIGFHIVNWFTLNLFFWQNALLVFALVLCGVPRSSVRPKRR